MPRKNIRKIKEPEIGPPVPKKLKLSKAKLSDLVKSELIALVRCHSCVWDKTDPDYKNNQRKYAAWKSVGDTLNVTPEGAKAEFKKLVDQFRVKLASVAGKSGDGFDEEKADAVQWKFFRSLLFLKDTFQKRATHTNFTQETEEDEVAGEEAEMSDSEVNIENVASGSPNSSLTDSIPGASSVIHIPGTNVVEVMQTPKSVPRSKAGHDGPTKKDSPISWQKQVSNHMDKVVELLKPSEDSATEKFLNYLGEILESVPQEKNRKCQKAILQVANAFADGQDDMLILSTAE